MFKKGDLVDIVFTGEQSTGGIGRSYIFACMKNNPYKIRALSGDWAILCGIRCTWIPALLQHARPKTPDWEL